MAETKKKNPYMMIVHLVIGVVIAILFSKLTPPGQITPMGMALIATFLVTNYWFIAIDMVTGSLASMIMFPLLPKLRQAALLPGLWETPRYGR